MKAPGTKKPLSANDRAALLQTLQARFEKTRAAIPVSSGRKCRPVSKPKPTNSGRSAIDLATEMGIELLDEAQYQALQQLGEFDLKTLQLGEDAPGHPRARRCALLRVPLRPRLRGA